MACQRAQSTLPCLHRPTQHRGGWTPPAQARSDIGHAASGLSGTRVIERRAHHGPNLFHESKQRSLLLQFLARFRNPLVLILLVASAVSAMTGEMANFVIINAIVLLSVALDFVQEYRANTAAEKLRASVSLRTSVMRDGASFRVQ